MMRSCFRRRCFKQGWVIAFLVAFAVVRLPAQWSPQEATAVTLTIVQTGGEATLQWKAEHGFLYTLMYAPERRAGVEWRPHPEYTRIRGEGQTVTAKDRVPQGVQRHYRLHVEPDTIRRR